MEEHVEYEEPAGTETILLAEDDPMVLKLAETILTRAGYTVVTAEDEAEAVAALREHPDIDLLRRLREQLDA